MSGFGSPAYLESPRPRQVGTFARATAASLPTARALGFWHPTQHLRQVAPAINQTACQGWVPGGAGQIAVTLPAAGHDCRASSSEQKTPPVISLTDGALWS